MTVWTAWDNRHLWPQADPDGYLFLGHAFDAAGEAIFSDWTGHEVEDAAKKRPERLPTVEQAYIDGKPHYGFHKRYGSEIRALCGLCEGEDIPQTAWRAFAEDRLREWRKVVDAEWRRDEVIRQLSELARTGALAFVSRRKGGGQKPTPIASEAWELDYAWVPFATLGCDERLGLASPAPTSWLFVNASSFARCLGRCDPPVSAASFLMEQAADEDASRFLFEEGEWVSASQALKLVETPESLARYAGLDNGEFPFLRSRCLFLDATLADGRTTRQRRDLHTWFWSRLEHVTSDWEVGLFIRRDPDTGAEYTAICVEFSLTDIGRLRGEAIKNVLQPPTENVWAKLPYRAGLAHRKNEQAAHEAARIIRDSHCKVAEAIRQVSHMVDRAGRDIGSVERGIRETFNLMYSLHGQPLPN